MDMRDLRKVYPFPSRNLDKEEYHRQKQDEVIEKTLTRKPGIKEYSVILATIVGSIIVMISVVSLNSKSDLRSRASDVYANFYLYPKEIKLNVGQQTLLSPKLNVPSKIRVSSLTATIAFNPQELRFDKFDLKAISVPNINYQSNSVSQANIEGKIKILMTPKVPGEYINGLVSLPQLALTKLTESTTGVNILTLESKVVLENGSTAQISVDKPTIIFSN